MKLAYEVNNEHGGSIEYLIGNFVRSSEINQVDDATHEPRPF